MSVRRGIVLAIVILLFAGIVAPYLSADRFGNRIREGLEAGLGRKVEMRKAHFNLFRGPGFTLDGVVIHEDPAIGLEPFVYVDTIEARLRLASLWRGRLEFSTLRLDEPSVNLSKSASGVWNFERILGRTAPASHSRSSHIPSIVVRGGRLNFKFGDVKSVFYLTDADLDIEPPAASDGAWYVRFSGGPARTDRTAQGFGRLRGNLTFAAAIGPRLDADLELEKSEIVEIVELLRGHGAGVHGLVASKAHLAGIISNIQITGRLQVADVHRWDLMPPQGQGWFIDYRGTLDLVSQQLQLETVAPPGAAPLPLTVRCRASDYLSDPHWAATLTLNAFPLQPVLQVARHLGAPFPGKLALDGKLDGVIGYSHARGLQGAIVLNGQAGLVFESDKIQLQPVTVPVGENETAEIQGGYWRDTQALSLKISTVAMSVQNLRSTAARFLGPVGFPLLDNLEAGVWKGWLAFDREGDKPGQWSGNFQLRGARIPLEGVADPLQAASANVVLQNERVSMTRIRGKVGKVVLQGDYRYLPLASRPHQVHLIIPVLDAPELERLMMPSLRRQGFIARALRFGRPALPDWLAARKIDAALEIGVFNVVGVAIESLHTRLLWDGVEVQAMELQGRLGKGTVKGRFSASLGESPPVYRAGIHVESADWSDGKLNATISAQTSGFDADLWRNLRGEGFLSGQGIQMNPETGFKDFSGCYEFNLVRGIPRMRFTGVQARLEDESYFGQGATQPDGRLLFDLSNGPKQLRVSGTLSPLELEVIAAK